MVMLVQLAHCVLCCKTGRNAHADRSLSYAMLLFNGIWKSATSSAGLPDRPHISRCLMNLRGVPSLPMKVPVWMRQ